jgi:cytochrome c oxidase cbb3-type subunit 1
MWMDGSEWLNSILPMSPYWFVRTLAGLTMDIGMTLLVFNLMMTALSEPAKEREPAREIPRGAAEAGGVAR